MMPYPMGKNNSKSIRLNLLAGVLILFIASCQKDPVYTGSDIEISFSSDTLRFDTVFTSIGSATRFVKVYNHQNRAISIREIRLSDEGQIFRMNVDGESLTAAQDVVIQARDSIYIFVEVTINPDQSFSVSPFIIEEAIEIFTGTDTKKIILEAWGQNANYFPSRSSKGKINLLSCNLNRLTWNDPRPYVIYGILIIDSCELIIPAGARIFVHGGVVREGNVVYNDGMIGFLENGKIHINGSVDRPVVIQGDRLEPEFSQIPGQWTGIRFFEGSRGNTIRHAEIRNSLVGIRADSSAQVHIDKSKIYNTGGSGIVGVNSDISIHNSLIYNNGGAGAQLVYGGNYEIVYSSFVNYNNQSEAVVLTNYLCSDPLCQEAIFTAPLKASIINTIVDGNDAKEILTDDAYRGQNPEMFQVEWANSVIKHNEPNTHPSLKDCNQCVFISSSDRLFESRPDHNYRLAENSKALGIAQPYSHITTDINGSLRKVSNPDAGCFESEN